MQGLACPINEKGSPIHQRNKRAFYCVDENEGNTAELRTQLKEVPRCRRHVGDEASAFIPKILLYGYYLSA
jgi:hypothetical protein